MSPSKEKMLSMYEVMHLIRGFEQQTAKSFADGMVQGFVHLYVGEEAIATGICANLTKEDYITSTHRGHGHLIAKGADIKLMLAELYGRETGYCKGKGGSMHIADTEQGILGANGIVGGGLNVGCGAALSAKMQKTNQVCVCFFGDGASETGAFHEAMNLASTWKLPVIFVNENNLYAVSCRATNGMAIEFIAQRALAYNMPSATIDGNDVLAVYEAGKVAVDRARKGEGPTLLECLTYRWHAHSEGEKDYFRPKEEIEEWITKKDPIAGFKTYLLENNFVTESYFEAVQKRTDEKVKEAVEFAENSPFPLESSAVTDVYTDIIEEGR